jgi:hypothetical protein
MPKDGQTNGHDEEKSGRLAICSEWVILFEVLDKKFVKDGSSQIQNFHMNFHKFHPLSSARLLQLG